LKPNIKEQLSKLGISQVFTREADLSEIDVKKGLEVSKVIYKAVVEVKRSSEVATTIVLKHFSTSVDPKPKVHEFKADHPFIFFIRDNRTGMILFIGLINEF
jgi:serpin B